MKPALTLLVGILLATGVAVAIMGLFAALGGLSIRGILRCAWRGRHDPVRQPLGGFRCLDCSEPGATMHDLGYEGSDYVTPPYHHELSAAVRDTAPVAHTVPYYYRPENQPIKPRWRS